MKNEEESVGQTVEGSFRQEEQLLIRHHHCDENIGLSGEVIGWELRWETSRGSVMEGLTHHAKDYGL